MRTLISRITLTILMNPITHMTRITQIKEMGGTVVGGAFTSVGASAILFGCQLQFFYKFGIFMCITCFLSLTYSLGYFMSLCILFGPVGNEGQILWRKKASKVSTDKLDALPEQVPTQSSLPPFPSCVRHCARSPYLCTTRMLVCAQGKEVVVQPKPTASLNPDGAPTQPASPPTATPTA